MKDWLPSEFYQKAVTITDLAKQIDGLLWYDRQYGIENKQKFEDALVDRAKLLKEVICEFKKLDVDDILAQLGVDLDA